MQYEGNSKCRFHRIGQGLSILTAISTTLSICLKFQLNTNFERFNSTLLDKHVVSKGNLKSKIKRLWYAMKHIFKQGKMRKRERTKRIEKQHFQFVDKLFLRISVEQFKVCYLHFIAT